MSIMHKYGIIGTADVVTCPQHLQPEHSVEVSTDNPDSSIYVVSPVGEWVVRTDVDYKVLREHAITKEWPISRQLEAITDALSGTSTDKLDALMNCLREVKERYPK